jgi:predicted nuclease of restriction endonuclease-like RecB superfamily
MLTGDLALSWRRGKSTGPRYLDADANYLRIADDLIRLFREHEGRRRAALDETLEEYVGSGTDYKILRGLIKLLTDRCVFETGTSIEPTEIRRALFLKARPYHPVNPSSREEVIREVAANLECDPEQVMDGMYADLTANQRLITFDQLSASELIDLYNLAQAQALLYRSIEMQIQVAPQDVAGYRRLFDAIKHHRLIHSVRGSAATGYEIRLSGPVSMFHRSQKYGVQMAVFLPTLLRCRDWTMRTEIESRSRGSAFFELNSNQTRLRAEDAYPMMGENAFGEKLVARWTRAHCEWALELNEEILDLGESAFIPDFVLCHSSGEKVYLEILGFWTPRYLTDRLKEFERAGFENFLLAASEDLRGSRDGLNAGSSNLILFKSSLDPKDVQAALSRFV